MREVHRDVVMWSAVVGATHAGQKPTDVKPLAAWARNGFLR